MRLLALAATAAVLASFGVSGASAAPANGVALGKAIAADQAIQEVGYGYRGYGYGYRPSYGYGYGYRSYGYGGYGYRPYGYGYGYRNW